jgi:hypothetical protein
MSLDELLELGGESYVRMVVWYDPEMNSFELDSEPVDEGIPDTERATVT